MYSTTLALLAAAAATAAAQGTVYVDNFCNFTTYLQSSTNGASTGSVETLPANTQNAYNMPEAAVGSVNNAITVSLTPNLASPVQFVYNPNSNGQDYYSLSTKFGDPFMSEGFEALSTAGGYNIVCPPRTSGDCPYTYSPSNPDGTNAVFNQNNGANFIIRLCDYSG